MPIYRKGRTQKKVPGARVEAHTFVHGGKRLYFPGKGWLFEATGIEQIEANFHFNLRKKISRFQNPTVVDWGCGTGYAIEEIKTDFPTAKCFGFSHGFYPDWLHRKEAGIDFIHSPDNRFFKYFKPNSVDVIFSHLGLYHFNRLHEYQNLPEYLERQVLPSLKKGGLLVFDLDEGYVNKETLQKLNALGRNSAFSVSSKVFTGVIRVFLIKRRK